MTKRSFKIFSRIWLIAVLLLLIYTFADYFIGKAADIKPELIDASSDVGTTEILVNTFVNFTSVFSYAFTSAFADLAIILISIYVGVSLSLLFFCSFFLKKKNQVSRVLHVLFSAWNLLPVLLILNTEETADLSKNIFIKTIEFFQKYPLYAVIDLSLSIFLIGFHVLWLWYTFKPAPVHQEPK